MKSIAISGMTASQSSYRSFNSKASFIGLVASELKDSGVAVHFIEPSVLLKKSDLDQYDHVLLGIAPMLSLTANKVYGILHMINLLKDDDSLALFVDAPEPAKIAASLRAIDRKPEDIVKPFYSGRKQYADVAGNRKIMASVIAGAQVLATRWVYTTLYPSTPFTSDENIESQLFGATRDVVQGVQIDSFLLSTGLNTMPKARGGYWTIDNLRTKWFRSLKNTLGHEVVEMKSNRLSTDSDVEKLIVGSSGAIISPQDDGTLWWSYRMSQALNNDTPVVSDWKITSILGDSWSLLPANVEEMDYVDIYELSVDQRKRYIAALASKQDALQTLKNGLGHGRQRAIW